MRILEDMSLCADLKVDPESLLDIPHLKPTESEIKYYQSLYSQVPESERNEFKKLFAQRGETLKRLKPTGKDLLRLKYQWYLQDYLACVASVDESVNQLLDYLKRNGLNENTVVVYTSDQGFYLGENGWFDKRFMYDVSMQSPLLVRWPGKIKPGSVSDALVQNIDMAPTFLDLAGEKIPSEIQGLSIKAILLGSQQKLNRTALYYHYYEFPIDHHVYPHLGIRTDRYKLIYFYTVNEWELYDLIRDPSERNNKIKDPGYRKIAQQLNQQLKELRRYYHDDEPAGEL
jgi:arylsulfatase A-like enzyme